MTPKDLSQAQRAYDNQADKRYDWEDETFVCMTCGKLTKEIDRASGQAHQSCTTCDDTLGFQELAKLMNEDKLPDSRDNIITTLRDALIQIEKGEGAFSRDPLTHASNAIDNMTRIAREALAATKPQS